MGESRSCRKEPSFFGDPKSCAFAAVTGCDVFEIASRAADIVAESELAERAFDEREHRVEIARDRSCESSSNKSFERTAAHRERLDALRLVGIFFERGA